MTIYLLLDLINLLVLILQRGVSRQLMNLNINAKITTEKYNFVIIVTIKRKTEKSFDFELYHVVYKLNYVFKLCIALQKLKKKNHKYCQLVRTKTIYTQISN